MVEARHKELSTSSSAHQFFEWLVDCLGFNVPVSTLKVMQRNCILICGSFILLKKTAKLKPWRLDRKFLWNPRMKNILVLVCSAAQRLIFNQYLDFNMCNAAQISFFAFLVVYTWAVTISDISVYQGNSQDSTTILWTKANYEHKYRKSYIWMYSYNIQHWLMTLYIHAPYIIHKVTGTLVSVCYEN